MSNNEVISLLFAMSDIIYIYDIFHVKPHFFKKIFFICLWFKDNFCFLTLTLLYVLTKIKSEKSTFVFKSLENKNHADRNYYQINKYNSKNSACLTLKVKILENQIKNVSTTVHGHKYSPPSIFYYIFHIKQPFFLDWNVL
jgi:hypothetical protein